MLGFSSDGDTRLLRSMRHKTNFKTLNAMFTELPVEQTREQNIGYIQDSVHVGTKLRNRMLKPSIVLPIGNKLVSVSHLKILINNVPKDKHGLVSRDVSPIDRQNFKSLEKVMQAKVLEALANNVADSEATIMYLKICREVISSLCENALSPLERVNRIWHATFFLRIWRKWIKSNEEIGKRETFGNTGYTLADNFITSNAYACVEINAHHLVNLIRTLRDQKKAELFLPTLFNSQTCEETFRQMRSMGTMNYTKINFSLLELLHLINRVELLSDIVYCKLANTNVSFPRNEKKKEPNSFVCMLPSNEELKSTIYSARIEALRDAAIFGMDVNMDKIQICKLPNVNIDLAPDDSSDEDETVDSAHYFDGDNSILNDPLTDCLNLKDYEAQVNEASAYVQVTSKSGLCKTVRKSSVVWLLTNSIEKLSSDRLRRVQNSSNVTPSRRQLQFQQLTFSETTLCVCDELQIGHWCVFRYDANKMVKTNHTSANKIVLGAVLAFKYIKGRTEKEKQYSWDFAPVSPDINDADKRGVEVLASWYEFGVNGKLHPIQNMNGFFINIDNYVLSIANPTFESGDGSIFLSEECLKNIRVELFKENYSSDK